VQKSRYSTSPDAPGIPVSLREEAEYCHGDAEQGYHDDNSALELFLKSHDFRLQIPMRRPIFDFSMPRAALTPRIRMSSWLAISC